MSRKILVTSALPYANGSIHLGHLVEYIQTDIWVRFQKMRGHDCRYVCADDTHGTAIMLRAEAEGITPQQLIDRVWQEHTQDFAGFHIDFDHYYSTHSDENRDLASTIYTHLREAGLIEVKTIAQLYDPDTMPAELLAAHRAMDKGVEQCYRTKPFTSDEERLEYLFALYEQMTTAEEGELFMPPTPTKAKAKTTRPSSHA